MLTKKDCLLILVELEKAGHDVADEKIKVVTSDQIPLEVLKKINSLQPMDILKFYTKLRKSYNNKKSKLYINIMKSDENALTDPKSIVTTLSALLTQILLFDTDDKPLFYKHSRADEITKVLNLYFRTYDLQPAKDLLCLIKADCKVLEYSNDENAKQNFSEALK